ncbi:MAG TPA: hypothetical protein VMX55_05760 [candidate division Zixibacteria bacterium]|nr:hypothetical protein [candidate division Zixibacteria bacterium]
MKEDSIIGIVERKFNGFIIVTDKNKEYKLYAIRPMEAVSPDFDIGRFEKFLGKKVKASGLFDDSSIWTAYLEEIE